MELLKQIFYKEYFQEILTNLNYLVNILLFNEFVLSY